MRTITFILGMACIVLSILLIIAAVIIFKQSCHKIEEPYVYAMSTRFEGCKILCGIDTSTFLFYEDTKIEFEDSNGFTRIYRSATPEEYKKYWLSDTVKNKLDFKVYTCRYCGEPIEKQFGYGYFVHYYKDGIRSGGYVGCFDFKRGYATVHANPGPSAKP